MKFPKISYFCIVFLIVLSSCSNDSNSISDDEIATEETPNEEEEPANEEPTDNTDSTHPNILLIIADDMGLDATPQYDIGTIKPKMTNLEKMMSEGLTFNNLWSNPTCTPTRAAMITGKYGFRTNMTRVGDELSTVETSLQKYVDQNASTEYANAVIGKWHLANDVNHPSSMGVDYFSGILRGGVTSYTDWDIVENGTTTASTEYTTTKFTDTAIDWIADQNQPWFLWLAYNAPHTPFHLPPDNLHSQGVLPADQASIDANPIPYYMAALEAMDTEMGRLLDSMSEEERANTIIIFVGDNGTPNQVAQAYGNRRNKDTVYEGGVNVPMVVSGKDVSRFNDSEDALITVTDIFATVADISGSGISEIHDSKSFKGLFNSTESTKREFAFTEIGRDGNTADLAIRNETHKYIRFADDSEALYNLISDPLESQNLLDASLSDEDNLELLKLTEELNRIYQ